MQPPASPPRAAPITLYVDADACPVKDEIYKVAARHGLDVHVVSNQPINIPRDPAIHRVVVAAGPDVADDWIAERVSRGDVVVTADIPLAARCVKAGADVIAPNGRAHTEATIGATLATRNLMEDLRSAGQVTSGPRPFSPRDRSAFLSALDLAIVRLKRAGFSVPSADRNPT
ncbi:YaiI/YqxD family protein [Xanthobacteraceae bacterium A53D]